jgi:hypothetical protein
MRNDHIETAEIADAEVDDISGGLLDGAMGQVGTTVENVPGADLGGRRHRSGRPERHDGDRSRPVTVIRRTGRTARAYFSWLPVSAVIR